MELKEFGEANAIAFTKNLLEYYFQGDNKAVINLYTSKDPESARDNVGWYLCEDKVHKLNYNIENILCARFGMQRGEIDLAGFYAFLTLCVGHEYRHYLQGTCIYDGNTMENFDQVDSFNSEIMMCIRQFYDAYYLMNKGYVKYELDADRFAIIEGVKYLKDNYPNIDAEKSMVDAVNFYAGCQYRGGAVLPTLPLGCDTYEQIVTAIADKIRVNKRLSLEESLFVYNPACYLNHEKYGYDEEKIINQGFVDEYNKLSNGNQKDLLLIKNLLLASSKPYDAIKTYPQLSKKYKSQSL